MRHISLSSLLATALLSGCTSLTAKQKSQARNITGDRSFNVFERVNLGGRSQQIWIRGNETDKPILLFLHGGPGEPHMNLAAGETNLLIDDFLVVQWDQRGSGASYHPEIDPRELTIKQMQSDAHDLIVYLLKRFYKEKIFLLGHSWGSSLGLRVARDYPELINAYIAVGLPVGGIDGVDSLRRQLIARADEAKVSHPENWSPENETAYHSFASLNVREMFSDPEAFQDKYIKEFSRVRHKLGFAWVFDEKAVEEYLARPENSNPHLSGTENEDYEEKLKLGFKLSRLLMYEAIKADVSREVDRIRVPFFAFLGRHDANVDATRAESYIRKLHTPCTRVTWFERSAHMMTFEEPVLFQKIMKDVVHLNCESAHNY